MNNEKIHRLATERSYPCVTISMNTHRTHPDKTVDAIGLKNLVTEAKNRTSNEFGKRDVSNLLEKIDKLEHAIDHNHNLDRLYILLSNTSKETIISPLPTQINTVHVSNSFAIKPENKVMNQTEEYYILLLSQSGVRLLFSINDSISKEIINDDFPIAPKANFSTNNEKLADGKQFDKMRNEYFKKVDKAILNEYNQTGLNCIVICTEDNYRRLIQVAYKPSIYYGYSNMNYNDTSDQSIAAHAWLKIKKLNHKLIEDAINEMQVAVGKGIALTHLSEINRTVKEGRGDLSITQNDYHQKDFNKFKIDIEKKKPVLEKKLNTMSSDLRSILSKNGFKAKIKYRVKSLYSIFNKIRNRNITVDNIYDLMALRIITDTVENCYSILELIHSNWIHIDFRFKDWVSFPKPNGYRSIHTTVTESSGEKFEIQIRTKEMHYEAEFGSAAHSAYKEGISFDEKWLSKVFALQ